MPTSEHYSAYVCARCGGEFLNAVSAEQVSADAKAVFGAFSEEWPTVCEDCYKQLMAKFN